MSHETAFLMYTCIVNPSLDNHRYDNKGSILIKQVFINQLYYESPALINHFHIFLKTEMAPSVSASSISRHLLRWASGEWAIYHMSPTWVLTWPLAYWGNVKLYPIKIFMCRLPLCLTCVLCPLSLFSDHMISYCMTMNVQQIQYPIDGIKLWNSTRLLYRRFLFQWTSDFNRFSWPTFSNVISMLKYVNSLIKSVKCYCGGRKIDLISSISEIQSQTWYHCIQYTKRHHMSLISHF